MRRLTGVSTQMQSSDYRSVFKDGRLIDQLLLQNREGCHRYMPIHSAERYYQQCRPYLNSDYL